MPLIECLDRLPSPLAEPSSFSYLLFVYISYFVIVIWSQTSLAAGLEIFIFLSYLSCITVLESCPDLKLGLRLMQVV